jgi:ribosomal protein S18 acetylase RimI-like enzyme
MSVLEWSPLTEADLGGVAALAQACLDADGGLPTLATPEVLRQLFRSGPGLAGRDDLGEIVAAAALFQIGDRGAATGLVHPSLRRQGHGESLVSGCREQAHGRELLVVAETMSVEAEALFARTGLHRTFAEVVMRHDLRHVNRVPRPEGIRVEPLEGNEDAFAIAFAAAFAEQEGYRSRSAADWLADERACAGFRPELSRVAFAPDGMPVGLVLVSREWIDLVGVAPPWRGRRLGAHLVVRSLSALRKAGDERVWLCVHVANPARVLYTRLGFVEAGTRARYEDRLAAVASGAVSAGTPG